MEVNRIGSRRTLRLPINDRIFNDFTVFQRETVALLRLTPCAHGRNA